MKVFVIGATGYVGSAVARAFKERGYEVAGLARNEHAADTLSRVEVEPVLGSIDEEGFCARLAESDVIVMAAMIPLEQEGPFMSRLSAAFKGREKHIIFTSGTGVLSIEAKDGAWNQNTFAEDDPFPFPSLYNRKIRIQTEDLVRGASNGALKTYVIRPPLIFGRGGSIQIPQLFESARRTGNACYLGQGLNLYSAVHVDDLAEAYCLAVERGTPGALYHTVAGEANFRGIAEAVATVMRCKTQSLNYDQACELWGSFWVDVALAVNSRSIARRTVVELGWAPKHVDVIEDIRNGSYRQRYEGQR